MDRFTATDGLSIAYTMADYTDPWKEAATVVMLHAGMGSSKRWIPMVPAIARRFCTVRMDLRGHGESEVPAPDSPLTLERMTHDVRDLMEHLGLPQAHFICNATGGYIGQHLAATSPGRVQSLVLFSSTPGQKNTGTRKWIPRIRKIGLRAFMEESVAGRLDTEHLDPRYLQWYVNEVAKNDEPFVLRLLELMSELDLADELPFIKCPTLLMVPGSRNKRGGPYSVMARRIPDVKVVEVPNGPQGLCDSDPDGCTREALAFLEERFPEAA